MDGDCRDRDDDPNRSTHIGDADGTPIHESWDPQYSHEDVMRALITEIRRLRKGH